MKHRIVSLSSSIVGLALALALPLNTQAKGYSSGGHSYSSHSSSSSSSHSFSSGSGHSFSSGSTRSASSGGGSSGSRSSSTKTFSSGGGKSYTSGSSWTGDAKGYSSGKSYTSGSGTAFSSGSGKKANSSSSPSKSSSSSGSSGFSFDTAAARARKEEASKSEFSRFKDSQKPPVIPGSGNNSYSGKSPPIPSRTYTRTTVYAPDYTVIRTRPSRINVYFGPYAYRPWVYYHDPYSSLFWWWLLDRSIDEQAYWAYHHRYDMDPARYDSLLASNQQLQGRVAQLEAQQVARDPSYTPPSLDTTNRDLMYSDQYVNQAYQTRSTPAGRTAFWVFAVPACAGACVFFIWLIWFKRWQPAAA